MPKHVPALGLFFLLLCSVALADDGPDPLPTPPPRSVTSQDHSSEALEAQHLGRVELSNAEAPAAVTDDDVRGAEALRRGDKAPIVSKPNVLRYPFGDSQPIVDCAPLRACDIELQAGEVVHGVALGDTDRWTAAPLSSGDPNNLTPHVIVKPKNYSLATNIVISTTRRTYHLGLRSPAKGADIPYSLAVGFYYPSELVEQWSDGEKLRQQVNLRRASATAFTFAGDPTQQHYNYSIKQAGHILWAPTLVVDDGAKTYIRFPQSLKSTDAPVLLATLDEKTSALNYRFSPDGLWYIADGTYEHMQLVVGVGQSRRVVNIDRQGAH